MANPECRAWRMEATIEERCNAGVADLLTDFIPERHPNHDTYDVFFLVGRRRRDFNGKSTNNQHAQYRSDAKHRVLLPADPRYVVYRRIPGWEYAEINVDEPQLRLPTQPLARVFRVEGQRMDLDIAETIAYMRPCLVDYEVIEVIIKALESEVDFDNMQNQRVLQEMFRRVQEGKPMIHDMVCTPYDGTRRDPHEKYLLQKTIAVFPEGPGDIGSRDAGST